MMNMPADIDRQRWERMRAKYPTLAADMLSIACEMDAANEKVQKLLRDLEMGLLAMQGAMLHQSDVSRATRKHRQRQRQRRNQK